MATPHGDTQYHTAAAEAVPSALRLGQFAPAVAGVEPSELTVGDVDRVSKRLESEELAYALHALLDPENSSGYEGLRTATAKTMAGIHLANGGKRDKEKGLDAVTLSILARINDLNEQIAALDDRIADVQADKQAIEQAAMTAEEWEAFQELSPEDQDAFMRARLSPEEYAEWKATAEELATLQAERDALQGERDELQAEANNAA